MRNRIIASLMLLVISMIFIACDIRQGGGITATPIAKVTFDSDIECADLAGKTFYISAFSASETGKDYEFSGGSNMIPLYTDENLTTVSGYSIRLSLEYDDFYVIVRDNTLPAFLANWQSQPIQSGIVFDEASQNLSFTKNSPATVLQGKNGQFLGTVTIEWLEDASFLLFESCSC